MPFSHENVSSTRMKRVLAHAARIMMIFKYCVRERDRGQAPLENEYAIAYSTKVLPQSALARQDRQGQESISIVVLKNNTKHTRLLNTLTAWCFAVAHSWWPCRACFPSRQQCRCLQESSTLKDAIIILNEAVASGRAFVGANEVARLQRDLAWARTAFTRLTHNGVYLCLVYLCSRSLWIKRITNGTSLQASCSQWSIIIWRKWT